MGAPPLIAPVTEKTHAHYKSQRIKSMKYKQRITKENVWIIVLLFIYYKNRTQGTAQTVQEVANKALFITKTTSSYQKSNVNII